MKKTETIVKDYIVKLSFDDLKFLSVRFDERIGSDLSEATEFLSRSLEIDRWLQTARSATEFYDMLDEIQYHVDNEISKRAPEVVEA